MEKPGPEVVYRGDLSKLIRLVEEQRGLDLDQYRRAYVERRVSTRLRALNLHTYRQYQRHLLQDPDEFARLVDTLTINVTDFFRDPPVYELFRTKVVPEIVARKKAGRQRTIRVWSAGCATGEEPYSLAMCFLSALGSDASSFMLSVIGTDLDPNALAHAAKGEYDVAKLGHIPRADQARYLDIDGGTFRFKPEVMRHVKFRRLNLFTDEPIKVVDVVFCRNVFIYFTREQQAKVIEGFSRGLARSGYLVLGRSEKMAPGLMGRFELVSGRDRIYRRI